MGPKALSPVPPSIPLLCCRAHLNEAPEQPALLLLGSDLLDPDCVVEDPFIAFQGTATLVEYWKHLRSEGTAPCNELYPPTYPVTCVSPLSCGCLRKASICGARVCKGPEMPEAISSTSKIDFRAM